jgi:trehalose 6-phosphate phosphatase
VDLLAQLSARFGGALALVSGRSIRDLDSLLAPLRLPCAGLHGAERRDAAGRLHRLRVNGAWTTLDRS